MGASGWKITRKASGVRRDSGYIDLAEFLLKVGQGDQTSPGGGGGAGGEHQVQRCGVIRYRNGETASTNLAGFLLKVDNAERNMGVKNRGLVEKERRRA